MKLARPTHENGQRLNGKSTVFPQRFPNQWPLKMLYNTAKHSPIHAHIHTLTAEFTMQGDSQLVGSSQGEVCLAQGRLDTQLRGAEDRTSNLLTTSQRVLQSESDSSPFDQASQRSREASRHPEATSLEESVPRCFSAPLPGSG